MDKTLLKNRLVRSYFKIRPGKRHPRPTGRTRGKGPAGGAGRRARDQGSALRGHSAILPCFLGRRAARLVRSISRAATTAARTPAGSQAVSAAPAATAASALHTSLA